MLVSYFILYCFLYIFTEEAVFVFFFFFYIIIIIIIILYIRCIYTITVTVMFIIDFNSIKRCLASDGTRELNNFEEVIACNTHTKKIKIKKFINLYIKIYLFLFNICGFYYYFLFYYYYFLCIFLNIILYICYVCNSRIFIHKNLNR